MTLRLLLAEDPLPTRPPAKVPTCRRGLLPTRPPADVPTYRRGLLPTRPSAAACTLLPPAQKRRFHSNCWQNRRFGPPGVQDGLWAGLLAHFSFGVRLGLIESRSATVHHHPAFILLRARRRILWGKKGGSLHHPRLPLDSLLPPKWTSGQPPRAQDGLSTGLLASNLASAQASWRPRWPLAPSGPSTPTLFCRHPGFHDNCLDGRTSEEICCMSPSPSGPSAPALFCRFYCACVTTFLTRHPSTKLSRR